MKTFEEMLEVYTKAVEHDIKRQSDNLLNDVNIALDRVYGIMSEGLAVYSYIGVECTIYRKEACEDAAKHLNTMGYDATVSYRQGEPSSLLVCWDVKNV